MENIENNQSFVFSTVSTKKLIDLYNIYRPKVGTSNIRNLKSLFQVIAGEITKFYGVPVSAEKCENKWKVLERRYKAVVDNNNKTGRGLKVFEFEEEFNMIYTKKKNIHPVVLLNSRSVISPTETVVPSTSQYNTSVELSIPDIQQEDIKDGPTNMTTNNTPKRKRSTKVSSSTYKRRNDILTGMREDAKKYYEEKLVIDRQRLEINKQKLELLKQLVANQNAT